MTQAPGDPRTVGGSPGRVRAEDLVGFAVGVALGLGAGFVLTTRWWEWTQPIAELMRDACRSQGA